MQSDDDFASLVAWLGATHNLSEDHAKRVANLHLPEGYGRLGLTATEAILCNLKAEVCTYSQAVERWGNHHSNQRTGECLEALPYYGEVLDRHVIPALTTRTTMSSRATGASLIRRFTSV